MSETIPIQRGFNGGKFSRRLLGRSDLARYAFGCEELQNFFPTVQGPAVKRSGTKFVKETTSSGAKSRLIPFKVSEGQAYVLELSAGVIRIYQNSGAVLEGDQNFTGAPTAANPVVCSDTSHPFENGDSVYITGSAMTELNGRFFTVANKATNTYELAGENGSVPSPGRSTGTGGKAQRHYAIKHGVSSNDIPWTEAQLNKIQFIQTGDLLYLVHPDHPPHEVIRLGSTSWTCKALEYDFIPLAKENDDENITVSIDSPLVGASRTITGVGTNFTSADIGRYIAIGSDPAADDLIAEWTPDTALNKVNNTVEESGVALHIDYHRIQYEGRVYRYTTAIPSAGTGRKPPVHEDGAQSDGVASLTFVNSGWGYALITGVASTTSITVTVIVEMPVSSSSTSPYRGLTTDMWAFGAWDTVNKFPSSVAFFEDRLWFGGTEAEPQTVWASRTGNYNDFRITPTDLADTGLQFEFLSSTLNKIEWMEGDDLLYAGTAGGEFTIDSGSTTEGVTPSTVRVRRRSNYGTQASIQPKSVDSSILFLRQTNDMHELTFDFNSDRYIAPELTRLAYDILDPGAISIEYQRDPLRLVWVLKTDGTAAVLAYDKVEDVLGWADVVVGGTDTVIESLAVIPHPDGDEDQVWLTVKRTVNGATARYVEVLEKLFNSNTAQVDAYFVDGGMTYSGSSATTITGLNHLEGQTVVVVADGARKADKTVQYGAITLSAAATKVHVGLPMGSAKVQTLPIETSRSTLSTASSQGWLGRVTNIVLLVEDAGNSIEYGPDFTTMDRWNFRHASDAMGSPVPLYTGYSPSLDLPSTWAQTRQIAIRHDEPTPCVLLAIVGKAELEVL